MKESVMQGTTLKVYRFLYKHAKSAGITEVQKGVGLSSPSVAQYHIRKLLDAGLIKEAEQGYVVDKVIFENTIRIGVAVIPLKAAYLSFFVVSLGLMITLLKPLTLTPIYIFALIIDIAAVGIFAFETFQAWRSKGV